MTISLTSQLSKLNQSQLDTITYESGLDANGVFSTASFNTYFTSPLELPGATVGGGADITFAFDPGAGFTELQQAYMAESLAVWSGMANINFSYTSNVASAKLVFIKANSTYNGTTVGPGTSESASSTLTGDPNIATLNSAIIQIDGGGTYGDIASYTIQGGYGIDTLVHEVGHLVGLGHTGPYNGDAISSTQQNNSTDLRTWSIMSYIDPSDTAAKFYSGYSPTGTDWGTTSDLSLRAPYTPMGLDIFAAQRIVGAPTSTMFAGGQIFGFNSNVMYTTIAGGQATLSMYDFTIDINPIVTIYDYGVNNTLDLSGFGVASTINLNPGTFSSTSGQVNNIFIEYGTQIDAVIGGAGDDTFTVNGDSDTINGGAGNDMVLFSNEMASFTLSTAGSVTTVTGFGATYTLTNVETAKFTDATVTLPCFAEGTRIRTIRGDIPVEDLVVADRVLTHAGSFKPVRWIGHRRVVCDAHPSPQTVWPVRVAAGAFGADLPIRDLFLSPDHALFIDDVLIPVKYLVNGGSIAIAPRPAVTYYHVELVSHDVLLAEGLAAESYLDTGDRGTFSNSGEPIRLIPQLAARTWEMAGCAPLIVTGPVLEAARAKLTAFASKRNPALAA